MPVFAISPLSDARWSDLVSRHRRAGMFHSSGWLSALQRAYGYEPVAFTTSAPTEPMKNGLVCCKVKGWITGRRLVSLPFSDHCDVLADSAAEHEELLTHLRELVARDGYAYAEIRSMTISEREPSGALYPMASETFYLHRVSLNEPIETLFRQMHKNCIQRKIRRAEKEGLTYEAGRSQSLLRRFYDLLLRTRRRHRLPPQPLYWFRNLVDSMGDSLTIRMVSKDHRPVAAMLTLSDKATVTYKYGCSDERFHNLGGTPFLFWKTIQEAKNAGMRELDLGRTELDHAGLVDFKDRLGAVKTLLTYWRYPGARAADRVRPTWQLQLARGIFSRIPDSILVASGRFLYRHIG